MVSKIVFAIFFNVDRYIYLSEHMYTMNELQIHDIEHN